MPEIRDNLPVSDLRPNAASCSGRRARRRAGRAHAAAGGERALRLALAAAGHIACLWAPWAVAHFPLAGAMFTGRPYSYESTEASVVVIGWIFLVVWALWAAVTIGTGLWS